jgi:class 3 adenylate cyclase
MAEQSTHILIVDDNINNCDLLGRRLERRGIATTAVYGGRDALDLLHQQSFDLVLLDIMMPEMSGIDVLREIRDTRSHADLPVIMATAKDSSEDMVEALELGANDYVTKPIDFPVLYARIQTQLALKDAHDRNCELLAQLEARNEFIRALFGRYVSENVVETLLNSPDKLKLGGEVRPLAVLFADIRGFTPIAESLPPNKVVDMLNTFFGVMTDVIDEHGGTINEFYGDGILAFFGAPIPVHDPYFEALRCGCAMQAAMARVNGLNRDAALPELQIGIGINVGDVVVGNIGSHTRAKYGIVGAPVNLAARVQAVAAGGQVLTVLQEAERYRDKLELGQRREIPVKGVATPVTVVEVRGCRH